MTKQTHIKLGMKYNNLNGIFMLSFATYINASILAINIGINPTVKVIPALSQASAGSIASG